MANGEYLRRRRAALFKEQNGICYWAPAAGCFVNMVLYDAMAGGHVPRDACTIDHLFDRFDPNRLRRPQPGERRLVAACWACNNRRAVEREAEISLLTLQRRSKRRPGNRDARKVQPERVRLDPAVSIATLADVWPKGDQ